MTNTATLFDFEGHDPRVVTLDGTPRFVAADVCKALDIQNTLHALGLTVASNDTNCLTIPGARVRSL
jgi:prophage antirepressor-like protein